MMINLLLHDTFLGVRSDLQSLGARWAVIGGLAVSVYIEPPRATRDIDLAIAIGDDSEAMSLIRDLNARGYQQGDFLEQETVGRLATVRMIAEKERAPVFIDLMFASSGLEAEIVEEAVHLEVLPGITAPVAPLPHLLALKVLARRPRDREDFYSLLATAEPRDLARVRDLLTLMQERQYHREKDLFEEFQKLMTERE